MKKYFILIILLILGFISIINAQVVKYNANISEALKTQIDNEKNVFFTKEIGLTQEQAPHFWQIYNVFQKEEAELREKERELVDKCISDNLSDNQYKQIFRAIRINEKRKEEIKDNFWNNLDGVLTAKQKILFIRATNQYRSMLLEKLKAPSKAYIYK